MRKELPKQYDPTQVESQIYQMWLDNDCFKAEPDPGKKPYSSSCRLPTSPASFIWATRSTPRCRTF